MYRENVMYREKNQKHVKDINSMKNLQQHRSYYIKLYFVFRQQVVFEIKLFHVHRPQLMRFRSFGKKNLSFLEKISCLTFKQMLSRHRDKLFEVSVLPVRTLVNIWVLQLELQDEIHSYDYCCQLKTVELNTKIIS